MSFLLISLPWLSNGLLWRTNKLKQGQRLWCTITIWLSYIYIYIYNNLDIYNLDIINIEINHFVGSYKYAINFKKTYCFKIRKRVSKCKSLKWNWKEQKRGTEKGLWKIQIIFIKSQQNWYLKNQQGNV